MLDDLDPDYVFLLTDRLDEFKDWNAVALAQARVFRDDATPYDVTSNALALLYMLVVRERIICEDETTLTTLLDFLWRAIWADHPTYQTDGLDVELCGFAVIDLALVRCRIVCTEQKTLERLIELVANVLMRGNSHPVDALKRLSFLQTKERQFRAVRS